MKGNKKEPNNNTHEICFQLLVAAVEEMLRAPKLSRRELFEDKIFTKVGTLASALEMSHFDPAFVPSALDKLRQFTDMKMDRMPQSIKLRLAELIRNLESRPTK